MKEYSTPEFWKGVAKGSVITLNDSQAIEDSIEEGDGVKGQDFLIEETFFIEQEDSMCEWIIFRFEDTTQFLVVKIVDEEISLRIYFDPPEFTQGSRKDMLDNEHYWMFQEPEDPDHIDCNDLEFTETITQVVDDKQEAEYSLKEHGFLVGENQIGDVILMAEYSTEVECKNEEILIMETGESQEDGGFISFSLGTNINSSDIDVLVNKGKE